MRPETLGDLPLDFGRRGVQRRIRMGEMPGFPALSWVFREAWENAGLSGWRRSADRTRLQPNSLQTGNFSGKLRLRWLGITTLEPKYAAVQRFPGQFPTPNNREISCTNRVLARWIREFRPSPCRLNR